MMSNEDRINPKGHLGGGGQEGKTIDLQGVAAFVGLVELLAQELGTSPGRIQGMLPNGTSFDELVGEISVMSQGFQRTITLFAKPKTSLKMSFHCAWLGGQGLEPDEHAVISGVEAHFLLDATVEQILPQGRALARHVEDCFGLMDRMVTLGQSGRLSSMSIPTAELEAFEQSEGGNLVKNYWPKTGPVA